MFKRKNSFFAYLPLKVFYCLTALPQPLGRVGGHNTISLSKILLILNCGQVSFTVVVSFI